MNGKKSAVYGISSLNTGATEKLLDRAGYDLVIPMALEAAVYGNRFVMLSQNGSVNCGIIQLK